MRNDPSDKVQIGSLEVKNRVIAASGTFGLECVPHVNPNLLGAVVTRSITLRPQDGPPSPRLLETPSGLLSAVEVQSEGVEAFLHQELPRWKKIDVPLIANIAGATPGEYFELASRLAGIEGIAAIEINLHFLYMHLMQVKRNSPTLLSGNERTRKSASLRVAPAVPKASIQRRSTGVSPWVAEAKRGALKNSFLETMVEVVNRVKSLSQIPVIAKLFPFFAIGLLAKRSEEAGADILSLNHGFPGTSIDPGTGRSRLGSDRGILTGPAIKPMALNLVSEVRSAVRLPIIGMGGIFSAQDAREFLSAGASAVAVGTATLVNPRAPAQILADLGV